MHALEDKIRYRAYEIWERQGRTGESEAHWHAAEGEIRAELASALDLGGALAAPKKKAPRRTKAAATEEAAPKAEPPKRKPRSRTQAS